MKKLLILFAFSWHLLSFAQIVLPDSVAVYIKSIQFISSQTAVHGQEYEFIVVENVVVNGEIIIEAGAKAYGVLTVLSKSDFLGEPGMIEIQMDVVEGINQEYLIQGPVLYSEGRSRKTGSIVLSIILSPFFLFLKGQQAVISPNTEIEVFLQSNKKRSKRN